MPPVVLIDSVVIIGAFLERDEHHEEGLEILKGIDQGDLPPAILHDFVYTEVLNYLCKAVSASHPKIEELHRRLDSAKNFRLYRVEDDHFERGCDDVYFQYENLSLTDSISVSFMEDTGIDYLYSFDSGFDSVDSITRLNSAVSPF